MTLDELQHYLRRLPQEEVGLETPRLRTIDASALRQHFLDRLTGDALPELTHGQWSPLLPELIRFLEQLPAGELPTSSDLATKMARSILDVGLGVRRNSPAELVERLEAQRLLESFRGGPPGNPQRYALENVLLRRTPELTLERTVLANTLLRLTGREALRWLLTIETELSLSAWDPWHVGRESLRELLEGLEARYDEVNDAVHFGCSEQTLARLVTLGVIRRFREEDDTEPWKYDIAPALQEVVRAVLSETPWRTTVRAALEDGAQRVVFGAQSTTLDVAGEQSRIVTHEVRNALIPVRHQANALMNSVLPEDRERVGKILRGVNRVLAFAEQLVHITEAVSTDRLESDLQEFLRETVSSLSNFERVKLTAHAVGLRLPREPLARALRNVVENALQLGFTQVEVEASVVGRVLELRVDDNGPGVEPAVRDRIFDDGFTQRAGGTGYGLAMTRRILSSLGGSVSCEPSRLGGARFVLALPLTEPNP